MTSRLTDTPQQGWVWAADNDGFSGFNKEQYVKMLDKCSGVPGCLFVTAPDVVGDAGATRKLLHEWTRPLLERKLPIGYVLQDGQKSEDIPWNILSAVFIGGSTEFKLGPQARKLVKEAVELDKWVHMGRVNTMSRILYAKEIGCHSIDGSSMARWSDTYIPLFAEAANSRIVQQRLPLKEI